MPKPTFQRATTTCVLNASPNLLFVVFYHSDEEQLHACMNTYEYRTLVYVLTKDYKDTEH